MTSVTQFNVIVPLCEMQFIKHGGFQYHFFFNFEQTRAAFVYCAKERLFQSSDLKMLQHRGYTENCLCKQGNGSVMLHSSTFPDFKDLNVFASVNFCTFARSIHSPNITISIIIKSFFSLSTRELCPNFCA